MMKKIAGFSLLELIIVMAIIGILVAIAIPSYQIYTRRAHYTEVIEAVTPYRVGIEECFEITGGLDECAAGENGVPENVTIEQPSSLVHSIVVTPGATIIVTPKNKYGISSDDTYELTAEIQRDRLIWHAGGGSVADGYAN